MSRDVGPAPSLEEMRMSNAELRASITRRPTDDLRALVKRCRAVPEWSDDRSPDRAYRVLARYYAEEELRARGEAP